MAPGPPNRKSLSIIGKTTLLLLLITLVAGAYAQNSAPQNSLLFITSSPMGARVILDGNILVEKGSRIIIKRFSEMNEEQDIARGTVFQVSDKRISAVIEEIVEEGNFPHEMDMVYVQVRIGSKK